MINILFDMKNLVQKYRGLSMSRSLHATMLAFVTLFFTNAATSSAFGSPSSNTFKFSLPNGASIVYSDPLPTGNQSSDPLWKREVFHFSDGSSFNIIPRNNDPVGFSQTWAASKEDVSPSGQFVLIGRFEVGVVDGGGESTNSATQYCSVLEIPSGCVYEDQAGEICGAGWKRGHPAQWGGEDESKAMLQDSRPSAKKLIKFINSGQPAKGSLEFDISGAENLMRCDPLSLDNREAYQKISAALHASGSQFAAHSIDTALSKMNTTSTPPVDGNKGSKTAGISAARATLYSAPNEASATHAYLIKNDRVTVLQQSPIGWVYVDYINAFGKHLLRWIKADDLAIAP
ncbi:hypothetical protein [Burkholderia gladioli]|uniref:hypothetical protein n=1 Tax=Burkholderia gladioli TaxID=28095 RepID=UPI00163E0DCA|nr:hypothetical protein [Burkholderia gladioli]